MGSLANSSSLQTTIQDEIRRKPLPLSAFSQLSLLTLKPSPRLRLMPIMAIMDMAWPTGTGMVWDTMVTTVHMPILMVPMVMVWATTVWATTVWVTTVWVTEVMPTLMSVTTTARGLLMLSPLLTRIMDITTDMLHMVMPGVTSATRTDTSATTDITKLLLFCSRIEEFAM